LYEDRPTSEDAWDVDLFYLEKPLPDEREAKVRVVECGPLRAALLVERPIGDRSTLRQKIELRADSRRIDFVTEIDWHERRRFLRVLFPVTVHSPRATYEIQYGNLERPTHFNTSWDFARFEVPMQKWFDLSEGDYGVAILNDCKYGGSVHGDVMGLSLLRGTTFPDPEADYGKHTFTYSFYPHAGDYREGGVIRQSYELNAPLVSRRERRHGGVLPSSWSGLAVDDDNIVVEAVKPAEREGRDRVIVRYYEAWSQRGTSVLRPGFACDAAAFTNLLEEPSRNVKIRKRKDRIEVPYHPFAIRTVALDRADR
jgi:alpha-mannosidase